MAYYGKSFAKFATRYAFRNLWRNSRRTTLTIFTVLLSVSVAIVTDCYSSAILKMWENGAADTGTAHVQIHAKGYWDKQEGVSIPLTLKEDSKLEKALRNDVDVFASVRRLEVEGIISANDKSVYFLGRGVEPANELIVSPRLFTKNDEGRFVQSDIRHGVAIGKGLAESLGLKNGDEATLITQTVAGSVNGIDVKVVGIVDVALPSFSKRIIFANIEHLQRLIRMPGRYTELAVKIKDELDVPAWVKRHEEFVVDQKAEIRGWWDVVPTISKVKKIWNSVVAVISGLLFLSAALSVLNIVFMLVAERTVEIGTLMAIGAKMRDIRTLFSLEAALIGSLGGIGGVIIGNIIVYMMSIVGVPFESPFSSDQLIIRPEMALTTSVTVFFLAIAICYFSALLPSRRASRVEPVQAFRGQVT